MVDYKKAFQLPFSDWRKLFILFAISVAASIGSLFDKNVTGLLGIQFSMVAYLLALFVLFCASMIFLGYIAEVAGSAARAVNKLPGLEIAPLFLSGLKIFVGLVVLIVPFVLLLSLSAAPKAGALGITVSIIALLAALAIIAMIYIFPALLVQFGLEKKISAIFNIKLAIKHALTKAYFFGWFVAFAFSAILSLVAWSIGLGLAARLNPWIILLAIAVVDPLVTVPVSITTSNIYGQAYRDAGPKAGVRPSRARRAAKSKSL